MENQLRYAVYVPDFSKNQQNHGWIRVSPYFIEKEKAEKFVEEYYKLFDVCNLVQKEI